MDKDQRCRHGLRTFMAGGLLGFAILMSGGSPMSPTPSASAAPPAQPPVWDACAPFGIDWCALFGVRGAYVTGGADIAIGMRWTMHSGWFTNTAEGLPDWPVVYPDDYTPADADPLQDFIGKLQAVTIVVDQGTAAERVFVSDPPSLAATTWGEMFGGDVPIPDAQGVAMVPMLRGLPLGSHAVRVLWTLSARHCDGFTTVGEDSCLPAATFCVRGCGGGFRFNVVSRRR